MGVLADIYSGSNTLKRRLNALMDDPSGSIALGVTRFGEDQNALINLLANAYPMAGDRTVLNSPEQVDAFQREAADEVSNRMLGMLGIDPKSQKALVKGLIGPANTLTYRLGDIKPAQAKEVLKFNSSAKPSTNDVLVTPERERHVFDARIAEDGFSAEQTGIHAKQAMQADSSVMPPKGFNDYPSLYSRTMVDPQTGRKYNAMMPLRPVQNGFELVTVIPSGLKTKPPKQ